MYICRLFHKDQPFEQIEGRLIADLPVTIGRDVSADWALPDPDGTLSRLHCSLEMVDGRLLLKDTSTNGTFLADGARAPRDLPVEISARQSLRLGAFTILVEEAPNDEVADAGLATTLHAPLAAQVTPLPATWTDPPAAPSPHRDASLLEAFCDGAKLDASALSSEDPTDLMRRLGAIYQQTVIGLATLMADRARFKGDHELERTTIRAAQNNPFKWAPTRKVAQDLLTGGDAAFLSDAEAVRASFEDLNQHLAALARGADAAAEVVLQSFAPETIEAEAKSQGSMLRSRQAVCWDIHNRRHAALTSRAEGTQDDALRRAFAEAYSRATDPEAR
ncbi:MAG: type VI secretion system-associated FHA domain protein TagH [Phenylobacterium sp.]|uniref:type VI secretion system-associated FHA domain protein TagH n=1 Tax=Phenylobacterium sp. TaxID=1871053 RepID=UPI002718F46C|nr:type VI secretion system-associated FHA domain protein TagH [Phenylobacterium sp.]MDO8911441.1 type VI secretion system-associated FHA domain protein TagH [Phenylobacterium sp.]MDP2011519.1 type VI secretion system-associated FHA domain protein TagH [Phenylobacterium sp.]MDP3098901.1 type VI secretion system-associated FHA domain protein TagH [Phenylobacterium sp.]MDP3632695.1 type VI secretion system-associated FHA domain protein TagH [Phenylobacterium sp.]MDP3868835.1 type VI secretion sy